MARIFYKAHYTELVEHFFRMATRHDRVKAGTSASSWFDFTNNWLSMQSEEDQQFIRGVFGDSSLETTDEALYRFRIHKTMKEKRIMLANMEKRFAIDSGLI